MLGRASQRGIDAAAKSVRQARGKEDEEGRADEEPWPPLERFPSQAYGRARRELHARTIAYGLIWRDFHNP